MSDDEKHTEPPTEVTSHPPTEAGYEKTDYEKFEHEKAQYEKAENEKAEKEKAEHEKPEYKKSEHDKVTHDRPEHESAIVEKDQHDKPEHEAIVVEEPALVVVEKPAIVVTPSTPVILTEKPPAVVRQQPAIVITEKPTVAALVAPPASVAVPQKSTLVVHPQREVPESQAPTVILSGPSTHVPSTIGDRPEEKWQTELLDGDACAGDACCLAWCLPPWLYSRTARRLEQFPRAERPRLQFVDADCCYLFGFANFYLGFIPIMNRRQEVRAKFDISGGLGTDCLVSCFCWPCALAQMDKEVEIRAAEAPVPGGSGASETNQYQRLDGGMSYPTKPAPATTTVATPSSQ